MIIYNFTLEDVEAPGHEFSGEVVECGNGVSDEWLKDKTENTGVDVFFECVGKNDTVSLAVGGATSLISNSALFTYGLQLFFNFAWTIIFFNFGWYLFAFVWLTALWVLVIRMIMQFKPINKTAAYLNLDIYLLN